jgi:hypothetical protein
MNRKIRINKLPASYYNRNDIPNMPDFAGTWIVTADRFKFITDIMKQDLARWIEFPDDSYPDEVAAWKRQLATLEAATSTDAPEAEPAGRAAAIERIAKLDEAMGW